MFEAEAGNALAKAEQRLKEEAKRTVERALQAGAQAYDRTRDLPGLIRAEATAEMLGSEEGVAEILARLERALRSERRKARAAHWTYDLNRHIALRQAYLAEQETLERIRKRRRPFSRRLEQ
ncbi:hypothetical protein SAMN05216548_11329 [Faunimonas pinastri]|uniref:Uncharacterized protein n=2 Tax=Faunimonas pinastri TaxID=1855383 RepID=A0A1H9MAE9_9HYPH|nr:hypothetical protein SAMN05216548_11329 [Faunimonas pinastri]